MTSIEDLVERAMRAHEDEAPRADEVRAHLRADSASTTRRGRLVVPLVAAAAVIAAVAAASMWPSGESVSPVDPTPDRDRRVTIMRLELHQEDWRLVPVEVEAPATKDPVTAAVRAVMADLTVHLPLGQAQLNSVTRDERTITIDVDRSVRDPYPQAKFSHPPPGRLVMQQLVWTAQTAARSDAPVQLTVKGRPARFLWGTPLRGPVGADARNVEAGGTLDDLTYQLEPRQAETVSGRDVRTRLLISNESDRHVIRPPCFLFSGEDRWGLLPIDRSDAAVSQTAVANCFQQPTLLPPGHVEELIGPEISSRFKGHLPPGRYLAALDLFGVTERLTVPVTLVSKRSPAVSESVIVFEARPTGDFMWKLEIHSVQAEQSSKDPLTAAMSALFGPTLVTSRPFGPAQLQSVTVHGDLVTVDVDRSVADPLPTANRYGPPGSAVMQELAWTARVAVGRPVRLLLTVDGEPAGVAWGEPITNPVSPDYSVLRPEGTVADLTLSLRLSSPEASSSGSVLGTVKIRNESGDVVLDPDCRLAAADWGLIQADDPTALLPYFTEVDCSGPQLILPCETATRPLKFNADGPPGEYLAGYEVEGAERVLVPVTVTAPVN